VKRRVHIFLLRLAIAALAPGAWIFWRFAAWRSRLHTQLNNLRAANDVRR